MSNTKKAFLHGTKHPCTENAMNMNVLRRWFGTNEWELIDDPRSADVIIISTCGFSKEQEDYEIEKIRQLGEIKKDGCELIVLGCLPKINQERLHEVFQGATVPTEDISKFDSLLPLPHKISEFDNHYVSAEEYSTDPKISFFFRARRFFEKIEFLPLVKVPRVLYTVPSEKWWCVRCAMGCTGNCSYCAIKHAQGKFKSESIEQIVREAEMGIKKGYKEIALTGEDLGGYGCDMKTDLAQLLKEVTSLPGDYKVSIRFIDPYWLIRLMDPLMPIFETGKIKAFCAPAQSGSDRILKRMNRRYTFDSLKETINEIMDKTKVSMISTNIIVGFPGETEEEFQKSLKLVSEVKFGMYMNFAYEDRPGTKASEFSDKISEEEKQRRLKIVNKASIRQHARGLIFKR
jgi:MiaB/RimO family radical SAM methylthiotransferase